MTTVQHIPQKNAPPAPEGMSSNEWYNYLYELISEEPAAEFLNQKPRTLGDKRQKGGGPKFVRLSARCVRYRRIDLIEYSNELLRKSTSDTGEAA